MAINQQPMQRTVLPQTQPVKSGNAFNQLAESTFTLGKLITDKANEVLAEQAAIEGARDVEAGTQPENLAPGLTKATRAYNNAVANAEARRMVISAEQLINEALVNNTNPATFTNETPAKFNAELQGIKEGILKNTRPENREAIAEQLEQMTGSASVKMLQHSIEFDNKRIKFDMQKDISGLFEARRNAVIAGDEQRVTGIDAALEQTLQDYSVMSEELKHAAPYIRNEIEQNKLIDETLHGYLTASAEGKEGEYLRDFAQNKSKMPFETWQKAATQLISLQGTEQRLTNQINAQQYQQALNAINNGSINDIDDLLQLPDLTVTQQLQLMNQFETVQRKRFQSQEKLLEAQNLIINNQSAQISTSTVDDMFKTTKSTFEQTMGRPMTLTDMVESALGKNQFPISGMPGVPLGREVPVINAQMKSQLQSNNPLLIREAAEVFNRVVNVENNANAISIDGRALDIASLYSILNQGQEDPNTLALEVRNTVMNVDDKEYNSRVSFFNSNFDSTNPKTGKSKLAEKFKDITGVNYEVFKTDPAFNFFKAEYRLSYLNSNSEEAADASVKYKMRNWGTSKYFDDGVVAQPVPEKELNITKIGNTFDNQYKMIVQDVINRNKEDREIRGLELPKIEWLDPTEQHIDLENLTDDEKVFSRLGENPFNEKFLPVGARPRIKVDGKPSEVYLMPGPNSKLGERVQYALFYKDKFGNLQPIPDVTRPDGVAMFSPVSLEEFAPSIFDSFRQKELNELAFRIQKTQAQQELNQISTGISEKIPVLGSLVSSFKFLNDTDGRKQAFRKMLFADPDEIQKILRQKINERSGVQVTTQSPDAETPPTEAGNIGIAADTGEQR